MPEQAAARRNPELRREEGTGLSDRTSRMTAYSNRPRTAEIRRFTVAVARQQVSLDALFHPQVHTPSPEAGQLEC